MSSVSSLHPKSFFLGVGISLSIAVFVQKAQIKGWFRRNGRADRSRGTTTEASSDLDAPLEANNHPKTVLMDSPQLDLRLLRKAEAIIRFRTSSITIIVERCTNDHNYSAILRTAEALGIQNVWIIDPPTDEAEDIEGGEPQKGGGKSNYRPGSAPVLKLSPEEIEQRQLHKLFAKNATDWLTVRNFRTTAECLVACRESGMQVWATDLSQLAVPLEPRDLDSSGNWPLPSKLAIVMGTEAVGCSQEMLDAADLRVYLPLRGFADSLNLSVAAALVIHHLFMLEPSYMGNMTESERLQLRKSWFPKLARQRLLSSADKKKRRKMLVSIQQCEMMQAKQDAGQELTSSQLEKISKLSEHQDALTSLEEAANFCSTAVEEAVADLVRFPPEPLSDLRRADQHRVSFVGKNTKKLHQEHWKDMAAVQKVNSESNSTASFFRERVAATAGNKKE
jgi:tRNA G18 (ribose-2'-O)-methylase SpoU